MLKATAGSEKELAASSRASVAAPARPPALRPVRGAALWASIGFVCGAIFWQAIGLWSFVSELVHSGEEVAAAQSAQPRGEEIVTGSLPMIYHVDPTLCTSLELDRTSNATAVRPCPREGLALRLESDGGRGDLAVVADSRDQ